MAESYSRVAFNINENLLSSSPNGLETILKVLELTTRVERYLSAILGPKWSAGVALRVELHTGNKAGTSGIRPDLKPRVDVNENLKHGY